MNIFQTIEINNTTLHISSTGTGDPVLFVHGACASLIHGDALGTRMAGRYRFISYSQRFHLPNPPQAGGIYNADTHADDLIALVDALGIQGCKVIGHSYGAQVILTASALQKDIFSGIFLAEPGLASLLNDNESYITLREERAKTFRRIRHCFEESRPADAVMTLMRYANGTRGFMGFPEPIRQDMMANAAALHRLVYAPVQGQLTAADIAKVTTPVTVLLGQHCTPVYKAIANEIRQHLPATLVKTIPDCAHDLIYLRAREIAMAIR